MGEQERNLTWNANVAMLEDMEEYLYLWNVYQKCVYPAGNIIRFFFPHLCLPLTSLYLFLLLTSLSPSPLSTKDLKCIQNLYTKSFFPLTLYLGSRLLQNNVKHQMFDQKNTTQLFLMTVIRS